MLRIRPRILRSANLTKLHLHPTNISRYFNKCRRHERRLVQGGTWNFSPKVYFTSRKDYIEIGIKTSILVPKGFQILVLSKARLKRRDAFG